MDTISVGVALGAGLLSFFSPCTFPLYPSYLSYITGISVSELKNPQQGFRSPVILHTLFFILGFSIVFYSLGFTFSWIGHTFSQYQSIIRMVGAILLLVMGLFLMGLFRPSFLVKEKRMDAPQKKWGYLGTLLIGVSFAAGWTPCLGPIFSSILTLAANQPQNGLLLITAYTFGFAVPFFVMAFFIGKMSWIAKYSERIMKIGGACMVLISLLLYTNNLNTVSMWLSRW